MTSLSWILMAVLGGGAPMLVAVALWVHPAAQDQSEEDQGVSGPLKMPICA